MSRLELQNLKSMLIKYTKQMAMQRLTLAHKVSTKTAFFFSFLDESACESCVAHFSIHIAENNTIGILVLPNYYFSQKLPNFNTVKLQGHLSTSH